MTNENPIGTLSFNLDDPYQKEQFLNAVKSWDVKLAVDSLYDDVFRTYLKYDISMLTGGTLEDTEREILDIVLKKIQAHFAKYDCNI